MNLVYRLGIASTLLCAAACGDDKSNSKDETPAQDSGSQSDGGSGGAQMQDAAVDEKPGLDAKKSAEEVSKDLCALAPWVLASIGEAQLPKDKIANQVRDDLATFVEDKPPICVDDADAGEDLCDEMPESATTFTYLYRGAMGKPTDPIEQVWCKSDNFEDLARIPGVGKTEKGSCEELHDLVVAWATAQLKTPSKRSIRYEANVVERGSQWVDALVVTSEDGDVLVANSPELYADTKVVYIENNGTAALPFLDVDFFGNHYCKLLSPTAALTWLEGG